jgi:hypothetical protein
VTSGLVAAEVTSTILPWRLPASTRRELGIPAPGEPAPPRSDVPLGKALAGLGVRREPLEALATPGQRDAAGREQVLWSAARLWLGSPVAFVTECFYQGFLDAYPGPWTVPIPGQQTAP